MPGDGLERLTLRDGAVVAVRPPGELFEKPLVWPVTPSRYGSSPPHWTYAS